MPFPNKKKSIEEEFDEILGLSPLPEEEISVPPESVADEGDPIISEFDQILGISSQQPSPSQVPSISPAEEATVFNQIIPSVKAGFGDLMASMGGIASFISENGGAELIQQGQEFARAAEGEAPRPEFTGTIEDYVNPVWWATNLPRTFVSSLPSIAGLLAGGGAGLLALRAGAAGAGAVVAGQVVGGGAAAGLQQLGSTYHEVLQESKSHDKAFDTALKAGVASGSINAITLGMLPKILGSPIAAKSFLHNVMVKSAAVTSQAGGEAVDQIANNILTGKDALVGSLDAAMLSLAADVADVSVSSMFQNLTKADFEASERKARSDADVIFDKELDTRDALDKAVDEVEGRVYTAEDEIKKRASAEAEQEFALFMEKTLQSFEPIADEDSAVDLESAVFVGPENELIDVMNDPSISDQDIVDALSGESDLLQVAEYDSSVVLSSDQKKQSYLELDSQIEALSDLTKEEMNISDDQFAEAVEARKEVLQNIARLDRSIRSDSINRFNSTINTLREASPDQSGTQSIIDQFKSLSERKTELEKRFKNESERSQQAKSEEILLIEKAQAVAVNKYVENQAKQRIQDGSIRVENGSINKGDLQKFIGNEILENGGKIDIDGVQSIYKPRVETPSGIIAQTQQFFESVDQEDGIDGRIPIARIQGEKIKKINDIIFDVKESVGAQIFNSRPSGRVFGSLDSQDLSINIRPNDLGTLSHEIGHFAQAIYDILPEGNSSLDSELIESKKNPAGFSKWGSLPPEDHPNKKQYLRDEGMAEYIRAWLVNPEATESVAPKTTAAFKKALPPKVYDGLRQFGDELRKLAGAGSIDRTLNQFETPSSPPLLQKLIKKVTGYDPNLSNFSIGEYLYENIINSLLPIKKNIEITQELTGKTDLDPVTDPYTVLRLLLGVGGKFELVLKNGPINKHGKAVTGGGVQYLVEPLDRSSTDAFNADKAAMNVYMVSERTIELAEKHVRERTRDLEGPLHQRAMNILKQMDQEGISEVKRQALNEQYLKIESRIKDLDRIADDIINLGMEEAIKGFDEKTKRFLRSIDPNKIPITGIGQGLVSDLADAKENLRLMQSDPEQLERVIEATKRYREWADANLRYAVETGLLSQEGYDFIKENNEYYMALSRVMETTPGEELVRFERGKKGQITSVRLPDVFEKVQLNAREIIDPLDSLIRSSFQIIERGDLNRFWNSWTDLLQTRGPDGKPITELAGIGKQLRDGEVLPESIVIFRDGVQENWWFNKDIMRASKGINEISAVPPFLSAPGRLLRNLITSSPAFISKNLARDVQSRFINSRSLSPKDFFTSQWWNPFNKNYSELLESLQGMGGDQAGFYFRDRQDYYGILQKELEAQIEGGNIILNPLKMGASVIDKLQSAGAAVERSTRVNEFESFTQKWMDENRERFEAEGRTEEELRLNAEVAAALQSRDLIDFSIGGNWVKFINQFIPFTNAAVQGTVRGVTAATENPADFIAKVTLAVALPRLLTYTVNAMKGDLEEYRQKPQYQRDIFLSTKGSDNQWISIPQPYEYALIGSIFERALDKAFGAENAFEGFGKSIKQAFMPIDESALAGPFKPLIEIAFNKDFFRNKNIVSPFESKLKLSLRKGTKKASTLGQGVQELTDSLGIGMDARNVDHFIKATFAYPGLWALQLSDVFFDERKSKRQAKNFGRSLAGFVTQSPGFSAKDVQYVMDKAASEGLSHKPQLKRFKQLLFKDTSQMSERQIDLLKQQVRKEAKMLREALDAGRIRK